MTYKLDMVDTDSLKEILLKYDLINSYFYNTHDLRIFMNKYKSTSLVIVRYPIESMYNFNKVTKEDVDNVNFRTLLMAQRVKYIFINNIVDKYNDTEICKDAIDFIGKYDCQIKW